MMGLGFLIMIGIWILIIVAAIWIGKTILDQNANSTFSQKKPEMKSTLEILENRYVRGEITREEFETMKQDLFR